MVAANKSFQLNKICHKKQAKVVIIVKSDKLKVILRGDRKRQGGREPALERTASMPVPCRNDCNQIDENKVIK